MKTLTLLFTLLLVSSFSTSEQIVDHNCDHSHDHRHSYLPMDKNLFVSLGSEYDNGYPEERFNKVIQVIRDEFGPLIHARGGNLQMKVDWTDGAVNAFAWREGNQYWLEILGGMARYQLVREEAFIEIVCHELGHLLGGYPRNRSISVEGQSDYYSTLKCMRRIMYHFTDDYVPPGYKGQAPERLEEFCQEQTHLDLRLCKQMYHGAQSIGNLHAKLGRKPAPRLSTPDTSSTRNTLSGHPSGQCRFDTLIAGIKCKEDFETPVSYQDKFGGACAVENGEDGFRPKCWFKN